MIAPTVSTASRALVRRDHDALASLTRGRRPFRGATEVHRPRRGSLARPPATPVVPPAGVDAGVAGPRPTSSHPQACGLGVGALPGACGGSET